MKRLSLAASLLVGLLAGSGAQAVAAGSSWSRTRPLLMDLARSGGELKAYQYALGVSGEDAWEARFMAGFIALRILNRPDVAAQHFAEVAMLSKDAYGKSTSGFWLGRSLAASGRKEDAEKAWRAAAQWPHTFYGQVASARLGKRLSIATDPGALFGAMDVTEVLATPEGQRIASAQAAGDISGRNSAIRRLAGGSKKDQAIACAMAVKTGAVDIAVDIARQAARTGSALVECGWPQIAYKWHDERVPRELVLAVAREESTFKQGSISGAGAKGSMQVTDGAAIDVGKMANVPINLGMVRNDADYNVAIGSYYLGELMKRYGNHPVLALAAYNAGPKRADDWIAKNGDPRTTNVDVVDWIEMIPFDETRTYVRRVMASYLVYMSQSQRSSGK